MAKTAQFRACVRVLLFRAGEAGGADKGSTLMATQPELVSCCPPSLPRQNFVKGIILSFLKSMLQNNPRRSLIVIKITELLG